LLATQVRSAQQTILCFAYSFALFAPLRQIPILV
jgi:hypothetical protein